MSGKNYCSVFNLPIEDKLHQMKPRCMEIQKGCGNCDLSVYRVTVETNGTEKVVTYPKNEQINRKIVIENLLHYYDTLLMSTSKLYRKNEYSNRKARGSILQRLKQIVYSKKNDNLMSQRNLVYKEYIKELKLDGKQYCKGTL